MAVGSLGRCGDVAFWCWRGGSESSGDFGFDTVEAGTHATDVVEDPAKFGRTSGGQFDATEPGDEFVGVDDFHVPIVHKGV